jgi:hypothetical protein
LFGLFEPSSSLALVGVVLWSGPVLLETLGERMSNPRSDSVRAMQDMLNQATRALLDNMSLNVNPQIIIPARKHKSMTATEIRHRQDTARKCMANKNGAMFPEIWSKKLLEDFAKDGVMGNFLKDDFVGPEWPQYAGIQKNIREYQSDVAAAEVAKSIDDHILDSLAYGFSVVHIDVKA